MLKRHTTAVEMMVDVLGLLEGTKDHVDHLGIVTKAYGLVNDKRNNPAATEVNSKAAEQLGYVLDTATSKQSKEIATLRMIQLQNILAKQVPNWNKLSEEGKVLVLDAKYNTGVTYKKLPKALEKYQNTPTTQNLSEVVRQSRRLAGGQPHKGLDNRVARLLAKLGYINNPMDAKDLGLDLTEM